MWEALQWKGVKTNEQQAEQSSFLFNAFYSEMFLNRSQMKIKKVKIQPQEIFSLQIELDCPALGRKKSLKFLMENVPPTSTC